jgi:hypothetical protein
MVVDCTGSGFSMCVDCGAPYQHQHLVSCPRNQRTVMVRVSTRVGMYVPCSVGPEAVDEWLSANHKKCTLLERVGTLTGHLDASSTCACEETYGVEAEYIGEMSAEQERAFGIPRVGDLTEHRTQSQGADAIHTLQRMRELLYPGGDDNHEQEVGELDDIDAQLRAYAERNKL